MHLFLEMRVVLVRVARICPLEACDMSRLASTSRLSLEEWDALSPLGETENESISRIQLASAEKSIPSRVSHSYRPCGLWLMILS